MDLLYFQEGEMMDRKDIAEELRNLEAAFPNKYIIDFYDAKKFIKDNTGVSIDDSVFESYLKEKGYRNILKPASFYSRQTSVKDTELEENKNISESNEYDIDLEMDTDNIVEIEDDLDFEDMDIDDILDIELKPNTSKPSESFINVSSWANKRIAKQKYSYADNIRLIKEYKSTKDANIFEMILELNIKLVTKQAIYYSKILSGHGLTTEDLIQEGCLGLMKAVERFDTEKGYEFSTYALYWINQMIKRSICDKDMIVRFPVHLAEQVSKVMRYESKLLWQNGAINELELCLDLGITLEKYNELKKYNYQFGSFSSLDKAVGEESDTNLLELIGEKNIELIMGSHKETKDPLDIYEEIELHEEILHSIDTLKDRERKVIEYRFGLLDGRPRTLEEVGQIFNVTRERIRQIESKAIKKLRHPSRSKRLKIFTGADIDLTVKRKTPKPIINKDKPVLKTNKTNSTEEVSARLKTRISVDKDTDQVDIISKLLQSYSKKHSSNSKALKESNKGSLKKSTVRQNKDHEKYLKKLEIIRQYDAEFSNNAENGIEGVLNYLQSKGCKVVDLRKKRGGIWVVGGKEMNFMFEAIRRKNINFIYDKKGCLSTYYKPGWHLKIYKLNEK